jgi:hypothetical protein
MAATSFQTNGVNQVNGATVIYQSKFDPKKFTDTNFLYNNYRKDNFTVYKGLLSLWNQRSIINTPLLSLTELKNNVMYVPNTEGRFRYSIPYELGSPFIVENLEAENAAPGRDGHRFKIKLSENVFSNTDIIAADFWDGIDLHITEEEIVQEQDGWIYTVEIVNNNRRNTSYPQELMQPGTQYCKKENFNSEYSTQKSSITAQAGFMDLELELGSGHRSIETWVTGYADMLKIDESKNPQLAFLNQRLKNVGGITFYANVDGAGKVNPNSISWHSTLEMLMRLEMEKMTEKGLMFSQGGYVSGGNGRNKAHVATGLIPQLRKGNHLTYNTISLELIERAVAGLYVNSGIPVQQRRTKIMSGQGGINQIAKELYDRLKQSNPYLIQGKDIPGGLLYGDVANAGFVLPRFTKFFSPVAGYIEFDHNPALDNITGNRKQDGLVGDYPISSYSYLIMDVTDENSTNAAARINTKYRVDNGFNEASNIVLVKPQNYDALYWGYILGTQSPYGPGSMQGMNSANSYDGYQIWMKSFGVIWVKDTSRTLLIEKAKPGLIYNVDGLAV